ncbi:MAG: hypothetical protein JST67_10565 [Bacteroidetes bacterium]|nr:hypothetical protein [Bacteroidota bacterium]
MKGKIFVTAVLLHAVCAQAQNDVDAMRYSQTSFYGDARYMSMGGAFGSLGGNLSCINNNPAGIAIYHKGEFILTPGVNLQSENATHYGTNASDFSGKFNLSNIGFVAAWVSKQTNYYQQPQNNNSNGRYGPGSHNNNAPQKKIIPPTHRWAFGMNYNRIADFNIHTSINGYAPPGSSIMNSMASAANGYTGNALGQGAHQFYEGLGYNTGVVIPVYPGTTNYDTNSTCTSYVGEPAYVPKMGVQQTKSIQSSGRIGELALALAHSFSDKLYVGGGIGMPLLKYNYQSTYSETDYKNEDRYWNNLQYQEYISTSGVGVTLRGGAIYRLDAGVRIGLYAQSPTFYSMTDNYQNTMNVTYDTTFSTSSGYTNTATASSAPGVSNYHLTTPGHVGLSVSYILGKVMAFSLDGEYVNYAHARFSDQTNYLNTQVNPIIQTKYGGTANLKAGVELNIRPIVFRAGFASYGSPFGNVLNGNSVRNSFTGGIGFRSAHAVYLDLGFAYTTWKEQYYVIDPMYVQASSLKYNTMYITATLGIKFN